ncbi:MAG TPA: deoxyribonuclease IV [Lentimicrobium sp.]|nr:deoxyribonuclease IV [Lentimicrobium sp.]
MKYIGAHVSSAGGVENAPIKANEIGAKAFAFFTKNQRQWNSAPLQPESIKAFRANCEKYGFNMEYLMPHDSYLINLGHPGRDELQKSRLAFLDEMNRCELLGIHKLNFHPGSSLGLVDQETSLKTVAQSINIALDSTKSVTAVIENTAGQGNNLGHSFEQIKFIIDNVSDKNRVGVCLDTCHTYSAGYDLVTPEGYHETFRLFDEIIGMKFLKAIHLNDTKKELGSHVDRHESIGKGLLGIDVFKRIMNDSRFDHIPIILETPDETLWKEEIELLYSFIAK